MSKVQPPVDYLPHFKVNPGDRFPDFLMRIQDGSSLDLRQQTARWIVLYFYPQDDSPTCTKQACNLRDGYEALQAEGIMLLGVSPDPERKHLKFIQKYKLPFPLVVDEGNQLAQKLGVFGRKKFMGIVYNGIHRSTFVLDRELKIHGIIYPVVSGKHVQQILHLTPGPSPLSGEGD